MCGIFFALSTRQHIEPSPELLKALQHRGPDATTIVRREVVAAPGEPETKYFLTFVSTVLSLRGDVIVKQPYFETPNESVLCWNGEAWQINGRQVNGNDTKQMFDLLEDDAEGKGIPLRLATVAGPYAFVYFEHARKCIHLVRDFLGRRSLLWSVTADGDVLISSVSAAGQHNPWTELEADGIYCLDLQQQHQEADLQLGGYGLSRQSYHYRDASSQQSVIPKLILNKDLPATPSTLDAHADSVVTLEHHLRNALRLRVLNIPTPPSLVAPSITPARLAILFSGGLDCTVLARISHDLLPQDEPIDLLNVAFENPRVHKNEESPYELCPDRITGRASLAELLQVCPGRPWRLVAINVPYAETQAHREAVMSLMHPHNTEMDLSISYALYFASRGLGVLHTAIHVTATPYTTAARVLLSGLGADELFAGYTRHATAFKRNGFDGLFEELDLDIGRLGRRNLGRDDRIISHWSKEVRFPFLDEELVHWALEASISEKTGFGTDSNGDDGSATIEPGKKVLRCLAWKLGMVNVAIEKKRAIQFGARTAKMETGRTKGTTLLT